MYLGVLEFQGHLIVHQGLKFSVVLIVVLLVTLLVDGLNGLLVGQIALDGNVAGIQDEVVALVSRDARIGVRLGICAREKLRQMKSYSSGMMMIGAFMSTCRSIVLWVWRAYSKPALVSLRSPSKVSLATFCRGEDGQVSGTRRSDKNKRTSRASTDSSWLAGGLKNL